MKNKSLTSHIMSYIIGEELCEYLKNRVHYRILKMNYKYFNYLDFVHNIEII